jgi:hypothetical protein
MDVWNCKGSRAVAEHRVSGSQFLVIGFYGPGTPVGTYDRFEVIESATGEQLTHGLYLYDPPCPEDIRSLVVRTRMARATA